MGRKKQVLKDLVSSDVININLDDITGVIFDLRHGETPANLVQSIRTHGGVIMPIIVRPDPEAAGKYQIIAGKNRFNACLTINRIGKRKAIESIPARVIEASDDDALSIALTENEARNNLHWIEQGMGYLLYRDMTEGKWQKPLAAATGKDTSSIWRVVSATEVILQSFGYEADKDTIRQLAPWIFNIPMTGAQIVASAKLELHQSKEVLEMIGTDSEITVAEIRSAIKKFQKGETETISEAVSEAQEEEELQDVVRAAIQNEVGVPTMPEALPDDDDTGPTTEPTLTPEEEEGITEIETTVSGIREDPSNKTKLLINSLRMILNLLQDKTIFCPDHPDTNESLHFDCGLEIQEAMKKLQKEE